MPPLIDIGGVSLSETVIELRRWPEDSPEATDLNHGEEAKAMERNGRPIPWEEQQLIEGLRRIGIEAKPATAGPDDEFPEPLDAGTTLSDLIISLRREP